MCVATYVHSYAQIVDMSQPCMENYAQCISIQIANGMPLSIGYFHIERCKDICTRYACMCVCTNMASSFVCVCNRHFMHLVVAHLKCVHCVCVLCMLSDPDKADLNVIVSTNGTASENGPKLVQWVMIPPPIPHIHLVRYSV